MCASSINARNMDNCEGNLLLVGSGIKEECSIIIDASDSDSEEIISGYKPYVINKHETDEDQDMQYCFESENPGADGRKLKYFDCDDCNQSFKDKASLESHKSTHGRIETFECDVCKKIFGQQFALQIHKKIHMSEDCEKCGESFSSEYGLIEHGKIHDLKCKNCKRTFLSTASLESHKLNHCEYLRQCNLCKEKFLGYPKLKKHGLVSHNCVISRCTRCNQIFYSDQEREEHLIDCKKFKCSVCKKKCPGLVVLRKHIFENHFSETKGGSAVEKKSKKKKESEDGGKI